MGNVARRRFLKRKCLESLREGGILAEFEQRRRKIQESLRGKIRCATWRHNKAWFLCASGPYSQESKYYHHLFRWKQFLCARHSAKHKNKIRPYLNRQWRRDRNLINQITRLGKRAEAWEALAEERESVHKLKQRRLELRARKIEAERLAKERNAQAREERAREITRREELKLERKKKEMERLAVITEESEKGRQHRLEVAQAKMEIDKERWVEMEKAAAQRREDLIRQAEARIKAREVEAAGRIEASEIAAKAKIEAVKWREKRVEKARRQKAEKGVVKVKVEDNGELDLVRDINWVYRNLPKLTIVGPPPGHVKTINEKTLRKAPSSGAVALAHYAHEEPKAFIERFVVKLLPKDPASKAVDEAEKEEASAGEMDPSLSDLGKWMETES